MASTPGSIQTTKIDLSAASLPPLNQLKVAFDLDGKLKKLDDTGLITEIGAAGATSPYAFGTGASSTQPLYGNNTASANYSSVSGGRFNCAQGDYSTVSGGYCNVTNGVMSFIGSGRKNTACSNYSTVSGGLRNTASGTYNSIGGGLCNVSCGAIASTVAGGRKNIASGHYTTVSGGYCNISCASSSTVGGGFGNLSCYTSVVGGGYCNTASGYYSTVSGGYVNTASAYYTMISGGRNNCVTANYGAITGGVNNCITGTTSVIGGGAYNFISGCCSTVVGGYRNEVSGCYSTAVGRGSSAYNNGQFSIGAMADYPGDIQTTTILGSSKQGSGSGGILISNFGSTFGPTGTDRIWAMTITWSAMVTGITGTATGVSVGDYAYVSDRIILKRVSSTNSIDSTTSLFDTRSASLSSLAINHFYNLNPYISYQLVFPTFSGGGSIDLKWVVEFKIQEIAS